MGTSGCGVRPPHARADVARVATISDMHLAPTATARGQALQEGRAFARRPPPLMRGFPEAGDVSAQTGSIGKILRPTDGGGIGILDDALPLLHRAAHHHGGPSTPCLTSRIPPAPALH